MTDQTDAVETINYRGHEITIHQDNDPIDPSEMGDDSVEFLVGYHNNFYVKNEIFTKAITRAIITGEADDEDDLTAARRLAKPWHIFNLGAYIHSGVTLSLGREAFYGRLPQGHYEFDTCTVGAVFIAKKYAKTKAAAKKMAAGLVKDWNDCLSGNVYAYTTDVGDSCGNFYGDYLTNGMIDDAKAEIDGHIENATKKHLARLRTYIKERVPMEFRQPLTV